MHVLYTSMRMFPVVALPGKWVDGRGHYTPLSNNITQNTNANAKFIITWNEFFTPPIDWSTYPKVEMWWFTIFVRSLKPTLVKYLEIYEVYHPKGNVRIGYLEKKINHFNNKGWRNIEQDIWSQVGKIKRSNIIMCLLGHLLLYVVSKIYIVGLWIFESGPLCKS